jgi:hypothetical protein
MTKYFSDGEYWTRKDRIRHKGGGKWIESVTKSSNIVSQSELSYHAKKGTIGAI